MFRVGQRYLRQEIHRDHGGQHQTGISTPANQPYIFIFTGGLGEERGYVDGWTDERTFSYSGHGQVGDMEFVRGNAAIRDHAAEGKDIHLFENVGRGWVEYIGQMIYGGYQIIPNQPDSAGNLRKVIQFHLVEISTDQTFMSDYATARLVQETATPYSAQQLFDAHDDSATSNKEAKRRALDRSRATRNAVLARANGICEGCKSPAPFLDLHGEPYLEPHHIRRKTDGGPDDPRFVIALCPNCHRRAHRALDGRAFNEELRTKMQSLMNPTKSRSR